MLIIKKKAELSSILKKLKTNNHRIGFVPTMGALHQGHLSLINRSMEENDNCVCSIFVNPTQFNNAEDYKKYPNTLEMDILKLSNYNNLILFIPDEKEIYPSEESKKEIFLLGNLETILEGSYRPGHFQGVCMVMKALLEAIIPDNLYLGEKDFQQCLVIKKLIDIIGLEYKIQTTTCPTLREEMGLAMSSRNMRLSDEEKITATEIFKNLIYIKENVATTSIKSLKENAIKNLEQKGFIIDYVEIADVTTLETITNWDKKTKLVALVACHLGDVRLIDNLKLD